MMPETDSQTGVTHQETDSRPGWDDLLGDVFDLNIRASKTIWMLFKSPAEVFRAARMDDWTNKYTPSVRVFFSLVALLMLLKFIWAGEDSTYRETFEMMMEPIREMDPRLVSPEIIDSAMNRYWLIYPISVGVWYVFAAFLTFIWGKGTPTTSRVRLFFAGVIPSTLITIPLTLTTNLFPLSAMMMVAAVTVLIVPTIDGITVWRGLKGVHEKAGRFWRAVLFGFITLIMTLLLSISATFINGIWLGMDLAQQAKVLKAADEAAAAETEEPVVPEVLPED